MANKKPLVLYAGVVKQLQLGDNVLDTHSHSIAIKAESIADQNTDEKVSSQQIDRIEVVDEMPSTAESNVLYVVKG